MLVPLNAVNKDVASLSILAPFKLTSNVSTNNRSVVLSDRNVIKERKKKQQGKKEETKEKL